MNFSSKGQAQIRFVHFSRETVCALVDDADLPGSLVEIFAQITAIVEETRLGPRRITNGSIGSR